MAKKLLVVMGMLAVLLVTAAVPAFAQDGTSGPSKEVVVTGVLRALDVDCNECAHYAITDEATDTDYNLISDPRNPYGGVDLSQYVGQKVTAHGTPQFNADALFVTQIQPADTETSEEITPTTPNPSSGGSDGGGSKGKGSGDEPDLTAPENGVDLNEDGSTDGADGKSAAATSDAAMEAHQATGGGSLPATGGTLALPIAGGVGALLVVGGLLVRRLSR